MAGRRRLDGTCDRRISANIRILSLTRTFILRLVFIPTSCLTMHVCLDEGLTARLEDCLDEGHPGTDRPKIARSDGALGTCA